MMFGAADKIFCDAKFGDLHRSVQLILVDPRDLSSTFIDLRLFFSCIDTDEFHVYPLKKYIAPNRWILSHPAQRDVTVLLRF
jgi:hypothetical protein